MEKLIIMENQILKFKTNINCGGCVAGVTPQLDKLEGVSSWKVDIENPEKILTIEGKGFTENQVIAAVEKAGFKIEAL